MKRMLYLVPLTFTAMLYAVDSSWQVKTSTTTNLTTVSVAGKIAVRDERASTATPSVEIENGTITVKAIKFSVDGTILTSSAIVSSSGCGYFTVSPSTGIDSGTLADGVKVTTANVTASGTPDATTYLRGDGAWETPSIVDILGATQTWTGANTFANASISSATVTNMYSGGKHWEVVYSTTLAANVSSMTITGLNGEVDEEYLLTFSGQATGSSVVWLRFHSDATAGQYLWTQQYNGTGGHYGSVGGGSETGFYMWALHGNGYCQTAIGAKKNGTGRNAIAFSAMKSDVNYYKYDNAGLWLNTTVAITHMTLYMDDYAMASGSIITLWARR